MAKYTDASPPLSPPCKGGARGGGQGATSHQLRERPTAGGQRATSERARARNGARNPRLHTPLPRAVAILILTLSSGCAFVPRSEFDECRQLTQTLRTENARLKDRVVAFQSQNRDYEDRAVDDARRLAVQDEAIERLEHSVHEYQDDRNHFEAAYRQMAASLGTPAIGLNENGEPKKTTAALPGDGDGAARAKPRSSKMPASATQE
jgi:hypothetical protein